MHKFGMSVLALAGALALAGCKSPEERAQAYVERGQELLAAGEPVKAALEFRNALKSKDDLVAAWFSLGKIAESQGRMQEAVGLYVAATERSKADVQSRVHLAAILAAAGQFDDALKFADQAYALAPSDPGVLATKAAVALKLDNRGDAIRFADEALKIEPSNVDALVVRAGERFLASDAAGALAFLDRADVTGQPNVGVQLLRLHAFEVMNNKAEMEKVLLKLVAVYPKEVGFRNALAKWYFSVGKKDEAEKVLQQFARENPDNTQAELELVNLIKTVRGPDAATAELSERINKGGNVFLYRQALAQLTAEAGQYTQAIDQLKQLIADTTDKADGINARLQLVRTLLAKNDKTEAARLIEALIADDANNAEALTIRGAMRLEAGQTADGIQDLRSALNEAPQSKVILLTLADAYDRSGAVELADDQYAKAALLAKGDVDTAVKYAQFLIRNGRADQAEKILTETGAAASGNQTLLTLLADLKLNRGDWLGAQEIADTIRKLGTKGDVGTADLITAATLSGQAKYDESARIFETLVANGKDGVGSLPGLIQTYLRAGKKDKAEAFLTSILKSSPNNVQALILFASLQEVDKTPEKAEASYRAALRVDPGGAAANSALAQFLMRSNRLSEAEELLRATLSKKDNQSLRLLLAIDLERSEKFDDAIVEYEKLFASDPRSIVVANNLASLLTEHRSDPASLDRAYQIAQRLGNSDVPQFLDTLGWIHALKGEFDQALPLLKSAADKLANVEAVNYHLGVVYKDLGQKDLAMATLKRALSLSPDVNSTQAQKEKAALEQLVSADNGAKKAN